MTIFTYGFENPTDTRIQIENDSVKSGSAKVNGITFRDYPVLRIDDLLVKNCTFENCNTVYFSDCKVEDCAFCGVQTIYADRTPLAGSDFTNLRCDNDCVLCLEDSNMSFCTFKNVELTNEAYLISGVGDVWIENCNFENIRTDRTDRELFFCEETVGKIFKKKVLFCITDTASCKGLENVICTAGQEPAAPADFWVRAMKRGLNVKKAMEAISDGVSWDEGMWDARTLDLTIEDLVTKVPVYNCLTRAGLRTVGDLARLDIEQILQIKYIGTTVVTEVVRLLHERGIVGSAWDYLV